MRALAVTIVVVLLSGVGCQRQSSTVKQPPSDKVWSNVLPRQTNEPIPPAERPPDWGNKQLEKAMRQKIVVGEPYVNGQGGLDWQHTPNTAQTTVIAMRAAEQASAYTEEKINRLIGKILWWTLVGILVFVVLGILFIRWVATAPVPSNSEVTTQLLETTRRHGETIENLTATVRHHTNQIGAIQTDMAETAGELERLTATLNGYRLKRIKASNQTCGP